MGEFLGESISKDVVDQLARRSKFADKSNSVLEDGFKVQQFLSSRGVWIRLISSVNEVDSIEELEKDDTLTTSPFEHSRYTAEPDNTRVAIDLSNLAELAVGTEVEPPSKGRHIVRNIKSNSTLAKQFVLSGGELEWNGSKFVPREGVNFKEEPNRAAYNFTDTYGSRPMPGITSFDIKCKNRFCSIREANITFNVWSLEDFKAIQKLYFRPGYSVILEWGDSYYIDENEDIVEALQSEKPVDVNKFFSNGTFKELETILKDKKDAYGTSYDSFIGYVTNFNWSFRKDGGYDCSIKVVSKGSILESLTVEKSVSFNTDVAVAQKGDNDYRNKSAFHYLLGTFTDNTYQYSEEGIDFRDGRLFTILKDVPLKTFLKGYDFVNDFQEQESKDMPVAMINVDTVLEGVNWRGKEIDNGERTKTFFITLRSFLRILNTYYLPKNQENNALEFKFDTLSKNRYLTFTNHFSINPLQCFLPKTTIQKELKFKKYGDPDSPLTVNNSFHIDPLSSDLQSFYKIGTDQEILNIGVSLNTVVEELDKILVKRGPLENKNLYDLIKNILQIINENLGDVNDLDIQIDEDNVATLVDRNYTYFEEYGNLDLTKPRNLKLSGITSLVENLDVQSTISSQLSSQIAISAQSDVGPDGQINLSLLGWNKGLIDRFTPVRTTTFIPSQEDTYPLNYDEKRETFISRCIKIFRQINHIRGSAGGEGSRTPIFHRKFFNEEKDTISALLAEFKLRTREALLSELAGKEKPLPGLIPITLSFTVDGISGFKIGQSFLIGKPEEPFPLLPEVYSVYSYVITGVEHKVQNNKWFTTVSAIPFKGQKTRSKKDILGPGEY